MQRAPDGHLTRDLVGLSRALKIPADDVREYCFTAGRRISFILERRIAKEVLQGADYDLKDRSGGKGEAGQLGAGTKISRKRALSLLEEEQR